MSDRIKLLVAEGANTGFAKHLRNAPESGQFQLIEPQDADEATLLAAAASADVIITQKAEITAAVIAAARSLKFIQKHGLNCRNIDVAAARARGIEVGTISLLRSATVAEHALGLMLACARRFMAGHDAVSQGVYRQAGLEPVLTDQSVFRMNWANIGGMTELFEATVGIVGMGDIGIEVAKRCRAFNMNILYHQRSPHERHIEDSLAARYLPLDELIAASDYLVLAVPHTPQTQAMINERTLALMKPAAVLVNVGRGALIDEAALAATLKSRPQMMAGLDVYQREPLPHDSPLIGLPNVVLQPHTAGGSYRWLKVDHPSSLRNILRVMSQT